MRAFAVTATSLIIKTLINDHPCHNDASDTHLSRQNFYIKVDALSIKYFGHAY
jgi:hypothetical protein